MFFFRKSHRRNSFRVRPARSRRYALEALELRMMLSTVTWTGGGGSNNAWSDPANWSSNPSLPSTGDDVIIGIAGASVTSTDSVTINSLQLQRGATLSDQGGMTVANGLTNSGTITIGSEKGADLQVTSGPLLNEAYGQILCAGRTTIVYTWLGTSKIRERLPQIKATSTSTLPMAMLLRPTRSRTPTRSN